MVTRWFTRLVAPLALLALLVPWQGTPRASAQVVQDRYIVVLKDTVANATAEGQSMATQYGITLDYVYNAALKGFAAKVPAARLGALRRDARVAFITPDSVMSIDGTVQAPVAAPQPLPFGINRANADASPTAAIDGVDTRVDVDVAVIDTGIATHPDLNLFRSITCLTLTGTCRAALPRDGNGHGTHVGGTIGAIDNTFGVVGVAPGARLWGIKVLSDAGSGFTSTIIAGVDFVTANADQIEVANMSLGGPGFDDGRTCAVTTDAFKKAICNAVDAGVTFVVAAGNDSMNAARFTPAAYDQPITVSALADFNGLPGGGAAATCRADVDDTFADFSNWGADVDIIAPGVCITSTWPPALIRRGYNTISGTSMASPHVAGAAALYMAQNPDATPAEVRQALLDAGSSDWNDIDDPDPTKEPLLDVTGF
jgi:subtilisin